MKALLVSSALGLGMLLCAGAWAEAPAGATASCKDGTYYTGTTHKGACKGHKGVKEWLSADSSAAAGSAAATDTAKPAKKSKKSKKAEAAEAAAPAAAPAASASAAAEPAAKAKSSKHEAPTPASQIAQKAGGGPGLVWVNSRDNVYHCQGDEWYGKTKEGSYMTEAAAKAAGGHAAHGKECGK